MDGEFQLKDIVSIIKRRYLFFVIPFLLLSPIAVAVAVLLPPIYQSSGLILIESPQISQSIVAGSISSAAQERVEVIRRRVMTRANLLGVAEKYNVFPKAALEKMSSSDVVNAVRASLGVEFINVGARRSKATIAFRVAFDHRDPRVAARVANELVTLFMNENVRSRTQIATETTEFLNQEAEKLERQLTEIEDKIANYKQEHSDALPDNLDIQMQMRERTEEQIRRIEREVTGYEEELRFLDVQLRAAQVRMQPIPQAEQPAQVTKLPTSSGIPGMERYDQLRTALKIALSSKAERHPDVKAIKRDVEAEKARLLASGGFLAMAVELAQKEDELGDFESGSNSGDTEQLQALKDDILALQMALQSEIGTQTIAPANNQQQQQARNNALMSLTLDDFVLKKAVANERIQSAKARSDELRDRLTEIEESIIQIPQVDRVLRSLNRDYANAQRKYSEIRNKAMEAQIAENVEEASKSERFILVEPPNVPDQPEKPDRVKLLAMGIAASFAMGAAALVGIEFIDGGVRGADNLAALINMVPLAVIPYIETIEERKHKRRMITILAFSVLGVIVLALVATHFFYMPLDQLIYKVMDRFG